MDKPTTPGRAWWQSDWLLIAVLAFAKLAIHLLAGGSYGYFRDELYYIACSEHLDWGYVDQPPLIAVLVRLARNAWGDSLPALRFLAAVAGSLKVVLAGVMTRELGGRRFAIALACLATIAAPFYLAIDNLMTMNAFEPLFWMGCAYVCLRICRGAHPRLWLLFGLLAGLGLQNKHSMVFFGFALAVGLLLSPQRRYFLSPWLWLGVALATVVFLPNLVWEIHRGLPTLVLLQNIKQNGRDVSLSPFAFIAQQILIMNPLTFPVWAAGLGYALVSPAGKTLRPLGWSFLVLLATFLVLHGKIYYLVPVYPMLFAAGAVALEGPLSRPRLRWLQPAALVSLALCGALLAPMGLPILPLSTYQAYARTMHLVPPQVEHQPEGQLPQLYADMFGWEEMAASVARVYHRLPPAQQARTAIFAHSYGEAAAIDFFGPKYGLPKAISPHQNYFYWGPRDYSGQSLIFLGASRDDLPGTFDSVQVVGKTNHPYARPDENFEILLCQGLHGRLGDLWPQLKQWN